MLMMIHIKECGRKREKDKMELYLRGCGKMTKNKDKENKLPQ